MVSERQPARDPRTIAREIPGVLDMLFPQLTPGIVTHFNRKGAPYPGIKAVPDELIAQSRLQHAMLFELAIAAGEQLLGAAVTVDWSAALQVAVARQRRHFDAKIPDTISDADRIIALRVAENLVQMLSTTGEASAGAALVRSPVIPGYQWIASGVGDFAIGNCLIEVKCTKKRFSSSDYRQVVMYWLLSYAAAIASGSSEWSEVVLMNPRLSYRVKLNFNDIIDVTSAGRSKVELMELFAAMVSDRESDRT